jgi:hypothetical protein
MTITLASMLAMIGLGGWEIVWILLALGWPLILAAVAVGVILVVRGRRKASGEVSPAATPLTQPPEVFQPAKPVPVASRSLRTILLWLLLACLALGAGMFILVINHSPKANVLDRTEFEQLVDSNRVVQATLFYDPSSPIYKITGSYAKRDKFGNEITAPFVAKTPLTDKMLEKLENLPNIEMKEPNTVLLPVLLTGVPIAIILAAVGLVVYMAFRLASRNRPSLPRQAVAPPDVSTRKCPQCGADLKPDAPEGLCPACLLKRGIATEGGVPPGTPSFTPPSLAELAKLFPHLEILEPIGQGGMGAVYKARQPALDRLVALKILAPRGGGDLDFSGRFTREARALAKLSHPNIVAVHDFGHVLLPSAPDPRPLNYFLMEFVDGPNLRQVEQAGKLSPREALQIIPQICAALQFAHDEGIVHRDIKPENVLLDKKGRVKIADFGLAKILGQEADFRLTGARDVMGTPHYMAPEQVEKPQEVDHRADIYSLGVVFYEMLTGELPLGKFEPPSHRALVDIRLDEVVLRSLEKSPARRYQHVSEVKTEVETIATSAAQLKAPAETGAAASPLLRFQVIAFTVASVLMALLLLFVGWAANQMGMFFNALFVFILLMLPVRIALVLWHTFHGTIEYRLWRIPLAPELAKYRWRVANRWIFWLLAAVVVQICVVPAQFTADQLSTVRVLTFGGVAVLMLLDLLPARRLYFATNAVYALGSIFMAVQIARIYWPESKARAVVLSMPVRGDWLVLNGGNSSLINIHYPYNEQRNAVDMEKLVDSRERTGDAHKLESYPSWGEMVYAPVDGKVVVAGGDIDDNAVGEMNRYQPAGNVICIDTGNNRYVMLAHLQKGSLTVAEGDTVHVGQPLAKCGNSGNTSHPHLHIQVQDAPRIFVTGKRDATTYPILFTDASRVRAEQTASGAPFFVRRNDQIVSHEAVAGSSDAKARATVHIRNFSASVGDSGVLTYAASVPVGYVLKATADSGYVHEMSQPGSETEVYWHFSSIQPIRPQRTKPGEPPAPSKPYVPPRLDSPAQLLAQGKELRAQLAELQDRGPLTVIFGEPKRLFSITNGSGDVHEAFFELVRASTNTSSSAPAIQSDRISETTTTNGAPLAPLTAASAPPAPVSPPPQVIRPLRTLPPRSNPSTNDSASLLPEQQALLEEIEKQKMKTAQPPVSAPPLMNPLP